MNSFIAWIGGKKLLRKAIIEQFPDQHTYDRYVEVFGGAGWVLFGKNKTYPKFEVFNDIDSSLINLYRCIKYHCGELQRELDWLLVSREQFMDAKTQLEISGLTDIQRAARYFLVIKASFGADGRTFGTSKKNLANTIDYLPLIKERLKDVVVENKDFENLIQVYDRSTALFYLDPPYFGTEKYYANQFTEDDHQRLNAVLKGIKGHFVLSYNDCDFIRDLYAGFTIIPVSRHNNISGKANAEFKEIIVKNY